MADKITATPTVESLDEIVARLNTVYQPQTDVLNQERAALTGTYDAQRAALDAQKVQGFNQINDQAVGKGMAFSGIPAHEQSNYLSDVYLPGQQAANAAQNSDDLTIQKSLAALSGDMQSQALATRATQQDALTAHLQTLQSQEFTAKQAEAANTYAAEQAAINRAWEAEQTRQQNEWEAAQAALNRAATLSNSYASSYTADDDYESVEHALNALGTRYYSGDGVQRFSNGTDSNDNPVTQTREQAAYALADATGITYQEAKDAIYERFKG